MRVAIVYQFVLDAMQDEFVECANTFFQTMEEHPPGVGFDLYVIWSNGKPEQRHRDIISSQRYKDLFYIGGGWDIGSFLFASQKVNHDLTIFCNSRVFFWKAGWGARLVEAREKHGEGLYATSTSYERCCLYSHIVKSGFNPHVRTSCFACNPHILREYPYLINTRRESLSFESGAWNFSDWFHDIGLTSWLVTWDGEYEKHKWRLPFNVFRKGDQSNLLVMDKHMTEFSNANPIEKKQLSRAADTGCR